MIRMRSICGGFIDGVVHRVSFFAGDLGGCEADIHVDEVLRG